MTFSQRPNELLAAILDSPDAGGLSVRTLLEQMPGLFWTTDLNLKITSVWGAARATLGICLESLSGISVCEFFGCSDHHKTPVTEHHEALRGRASQFEHAWGDRVMEVRLSPLRSSSGVITGCLAMAVDITDRKNTVEQAVYQARHDALTGLANYREFMDRLELELRRSERSHRCFTLLLLDLDDLKRINDLQGHLAGNRALQRLAAVMNEHCRSTDLAARYGGDEFAVILIDSGRKMAESVAHRIEDRLRIGKEQPAVTASIGIGVYPEDGRTVQQLLEAADRELYRRKKILQTRNVTAG